MSELPTGRLARTEAAARTVVLDLLGALILLGSIGAAVAAVVQMSLSSSTVVSGHGSPNASEVRGLIEYMGVPHRSDLVVG